MKQLSSLLLSCLLVSGCSGPAPVEAPAPTSPAPIAAKASPADAYLAAYGEIMARVGSDGKRFAANRQPRGESEQAIRETKAKASRDIGMKMAIALRDLKRLTPPADLKELHESSYNLVAGIATFSIRFADALAKNDQAAFEREVAAYRSAIPALGERLKTAYRAQEGKYKLPPALKL